MSKSKSLGELRDAAIAILSWAAEAKVPVVVIAGIAVSILSKPRTTKDIDFIAWLPDHESWSGFVAQGQKHGIMPRIPKAKEKGIARRVFMDFQSQKRGRAYDISFDAHSACEKSRPAASCVIDSGNVEIVRR